VTPDTVAAPEPTLEAAAGPPVTLGWLTRMRGHFPPGQVLRYLCVGVFNTLFGQATFAAINFLLDQRHVPASYIFASLLSSLINITVAYLGYKFVVFRTRGNYLREWLKAMAVYSSVLIPALLVLPLLVKLFEHVLPAVLLVWHGHTVSGNKAAPYIANALMTVVTVISSFLGHSKVTFRQRSA
jgi:putative flippase GtrA